MESHRIVTLLQSSNLVIDSTETITALDIYKQKNLIAIALQGGQTLYFDKRVHFMKNKSKEIEYFKV